MKIPGRILSAILSIAMLIPTSAATVSAVASDPVSSFTEPNTSAPTELVQESTVDFSVGTDNIYDIDGDSSIVLNFATPIDQKEVEKVQIVSLSDGVALNGLWQGADKQWQFIPYDIKDSTYYTIVVPADIYDKNGASIEDTFTHTFFTSTGMSTDAKNVTSLVKAYDGHKTRPARQQAGFTVMSGKTFLYVAEGEGSVIDLSAINGRNPNQNVRFYAFEDIWNDPSYVGKTVRFSFKAKASVPGYIQLSLNQLHLSNTDPNYNSAYDYTYKNFPGLSEIADLTTEWKVFTYEFTVTQEMYDQKAYGRVNPDATSNLALGVRFPGFPEDGSSYNGAKITIADFVVTATDTKLEANKDSLLYINFAKDNYSATEKANLRFAVKDNSVGTVEVYESVLGNATTLLGSVKINGAGMYSLDVTNYVKNSGGTPVFAIKTASTSASINLASSLPILSIVNSSNYGVLPTVSSSVLATSPNTSSSELWISGGQTGFDNDSVKSYVKLSLNGYTGGYAAFLFNAATNDGAANIHVYGVADVNEGQDWTADSISSLNAPANDIYGGGININEVYGHAPIASFQVGGYDENYRVYLTEFAEYMLSQGATEITLVLVSDSKNVTNIKVVDTVDTSVIAKYNCVTTKPEASQSGFGTISLYEFNDDGFKIFTNNITIGPDNTNANVRLYIFDEIWNKGNYYVNKTIRFSFSAKASEAGAIALSLTQTGTGDKYVWGDGIKLISKTTNLTTSWQTFTYEFIVTQPMIDNIGITINSPGLSLGIRFYNFSSNGAYKIANINFRNFVISEVDTDKIYDESYDFSNTKPYVESRGYNNINTNGVQTPSITNGELKISLSSQLYVQAGAYVRIPALDQVFTNTSYKGKTFTITFRAKATEAGLMDFSFNKFGVSKDYNYTYNGLTYATQYSLTTEYQTFTYQFVVIDDMFTTHASTNLNLAFRFHNGFKSATIYNNTYVYKDATIYIDDLTIVAYDNVAASLDPITTVINEDYSRNFADVKYDFSSNTSIADITGYNSSITKIVNGELQINPVKATNPNAGQFVRVYAFDQIWANTENIGKTFTIAFRAKASEAGVMDFALNGYNADKPVYSYNGINYSTKYSLTNEYQIFTYTFTVVADMYDTISKPLVCAFRFYNGFRNANGTYKDVTICIDDIHVYQDFIIKTSTISTSGTTAISGAGNSEFLSTYDAKSEINADLRKTYLSYNLTDYEDILSAQLNVTLSGAKGETVRVYVLKNTSLSSAVTYANAPATSKKATLSFTAVDDVTTIDFTDIFNENKGSSFVIVLAVEEFSGNIKITDINLDVHVEAHDHMEEGNKHAAVSPTYNASGNIEFYSCSSCNELYTKKGSEFIQVSLEDVILPPVEYDTEFAGASLNIGKDLSMRYHIKISTGENINDFSVRFKLHTKDVTVTEYTYDANTGRYIFTFCGIAPQLMGDIITAELYKGDNLVATKEYSVKEYVIKALELYPEDDELTQLLADILEYGAAAQEYLGYKTDALVNQDVENIPDPSDVMPTEDDQNRSISAVTNPDIQFTAAGVRFDYNNRIYVKFKAPSLDGITVSVNGVNLEIEETSKAGVYIAYSDAISALNFAEKVTFTLSYNGEYVQTLVYTINDYALAKHSDSKIGKLAIALYRYGKSAINYDISR